MAELDGAGIEHAEIMIVGAGPRPGRGRLFRGDRVTADRLIAPWAAARKRRLGIG